MIKCLFVLWLLCFQTASLVTKAQGQEEMEWNKILQMVNGSCKLGIKTFDNGNIPVDSMLFTTNSTHKENGWQIRRDISKVVGRSNAMDITFRLARETGSAPSTAAFMAFDFSRWSKDNYVMVPAIVYNGNRYKVLGYAYNPPYTKDMFYNNRLPLTISNNPRLSMETGEPSVVELQTGNAATPALCFFSPAFKKGVILLTRQQTKWGNSGLFIRENARKDSCTFSIMAPAVRKMAAGFGDYHKSGDIAPDWQPGDSIALQARIYVVNAESIPDLLTAFMKVRKDLSGENNPRNILPMSKLTEVATSICSNNFVTVPAGSYYLPENNKDFQLGWVSGMINTYPMLALNDEKERKRVCAELDFVVEKLQGKSGYFYGGITSDGMLRGDKKGSDDPTALAMVRKNADVLFWFVKHFLLLKEQGAGHLIKPAWENAVRRLASAFTATWAQHHEFGQYVVPENGQIAVFNSTAGALVPAGLALASSYFKQPQWLEVAKESAAYYYTRDVEKQGLTGGDCGDISQDANSESAFGFLESLMTLYYYTGDIQWIKKAEVQAALCATWSISYDPLFPSNSQIGKLGCNMAGAVWASIQNKHAAPGICVSSGDDLFKLYRATGNKGYAHLARDIQHAHAEAVNMPGHITTNNLIGSSMERIQPSDAEGKGSTGNFINTRNSWTETGGLLMALELPGIYYQTGKNELIVFDHVEVTKPGADKLQVKNPTQYDAYVSVFVETSAAAKRPLSFTACTQWPKILVRAGGQALVHIGKNGSLKVETIN